MQQRNFWLSKEVFIGLAFGLAIAFPVFVFGGAKTVFVDKDANGSEDGTYNHPYHSISKALDHVKDGTEVRVMNGTYKEHFTLPNGVSLTSDSENRDKVTIESDSNNKPAVTMKKDTALSHVTVDGGNGVRISKDAKAHIYDAVIKRSNNDGIHIESAVRDTKHRVLIDKTKIINNDRAGIYSEKRFIVLINSDIVSNDGDGIVFAAGTKAWFEKDSFNSNKGSGAKLVLDGSDIWSKSNSFRNNKREGVEINASGAAGNVGFKKASFVNNGRYGIARVGRTASSLSTFGGIVLGTGVNANRFEGNASGNISPVLHIF